MKLQPKKAKKKPIGAERAHDHTSPVTRPQAMQVGSKQRVLLLYLKLRFNPKKKTNLLQQASLCLKSNLLFHFVFPFWTRGFLVLSPKPCPPLKARRPPSFFSVLPRQKGPLLSSPLPTPTPLFSAFFRLPYLLNNPQRMDWSYKNNDNKNIWSEIQTEEAGGLKGRPVCDNATTCTQTNRAFGCAWECPGSSDVHRVRLLLVSKIGPSLLCLSHDSPVPFLFFQTFLSILCEAEAKSGFKTLPWPRGEKTTLDVRVLLWRRVLLAATGSSNAGGSLRRVLILRYVLGVELEVFGNKEGSPWGIGRILLWKGVLAGLF